MRSTIFISLPARDLQKSTNFFKQLGFEFNPQFTDENCTCMVIGQDSFVMLLTEPFFKTFTGKEVCDTGTHTEAIFALSADSREDVDSLVHKALAAGGQPSNERIDDGQMYGWSFQDVDGHLWEVIYMDPSAVQQ